MSDIRLVRSHSLPIAKAKALVQKAADAAALAGASQLTGQAGSASSVKPAVVNYVNGYACLNGISDPNNT